MECQIDMRLSWSCFVKVFVNVQLFDCSTFLAKLCLIPLSVLGHEGEYCERGKKRSDNTSANHQIIRKRVKGNLRVFLRKRTRDTGIKRELVRQMAKELKLYTFEPQKVQLLTDEKKRALLQRCRQL